MLKDFNGQVVLFDHGVLLIFSIQKNHKLGGVPWFNCIPHSISTGNLASDILLGLLLQRIVISYRIWIYDGGIYVFGTTCRVFPLRSISEEVTWNYQGL